jgi:hypothetical protein
MARETGHEPSRRKHVDYSASGYPINSPRSAGHDRIVDTTVLEGHAGMGRARGNQQAMLSNGRALSAASPTRAQLPGSHT